MDTIIGINPDILTNVSGKDKLFFFSVVMAKKDDKDFDKIKEAAVAFRKVFTGNIYKTPEDYSGTNPVDYFMRSPLILDATNKASMQLLKNFFTNLNIDLRVDWDDASNTVMNLVKKKLEEKNELFKTITESTTGDKMGPDDMKNTFRMIYTFIRLQIDMELFFLKSHKPYSQEQPGLLKGFSYLANLLLYASRLLRDKKTGYYTKKYAEIIFRHLSQVLYRLDFSTAESSGVVITLADIREVARQAADETYPFYHNTKDYEIVSNFLIFIAKMNKDTNIND